MSLRRLALAYLENQKRPHAAVGNVPSVPTVPTSTRGTSGTVNWALLVAEADKQNTKAKREHSTDRYCLCGRLADCAWLTDRRRENWQCVDCYPVRGNT